MHGEGTVVVFYLSHAQEWEVRINSASGTVLGSGDETG